MSCAWQIEIDQSCRKILSRHWPNVEKFTDVRECGKLNLARVNVLCGGFPCQDLSIAGRRQGIAGERSGLWFEFIRIIDELKPRFAIIENVPGLLSSNDGKDFAVVLRGLVECGYGVAWRIFDAQFDGVAQRRNRVFIVGSLGTGSAAEILFEREGVSWDTPSRRKAGQDIANASQVGIGVGSSDVGYSLRANPSRSGSGGDGGINVTLVAQSLNAHGRRLHGDSDTFIVNTFNGYTGGADDNDAQGNHLVSMPLLAKGNSSHDESLETYVAWNWQSGGDVRYCFSDKPNLTAQQIPAIGVRRLTPRECERLQAFPDDWTRYDADGKEIADSARYRMLGNAVCVNVAGWIGKRIVSVA